MRGDDSWGVAKEGRGDVKRRAWDGGEEGRELLDRGSWSVGRKEVRGSSQQHS